MEREVGASMIISTGASVDFSIEGEGVTGSGGREDEDEGSGITG